MNSEETYRIVTVCIDHERNGLAPVGVAPIYDTGCPSPTFGIVKPAVTNARVDMSPYGQSVFADAVDAVQAVDLTFDALLNEGDASKMRVFLSDVLFDREKSGDKGISIPFGKRDCTVFRKVMSTEGTIQAFAPAPRTSSLSEAFRIALQMPVNLTGFGIGYFDFDESRGYVRTATEVSSDNSALMRNIRRHVRSLWWSRVASEAVAALGRFLVGAVGRRLLVGRLGDWRRWRAVAAGQPLQRSLCRPRWLMDWTGADERVTAADRTSARWVCAAGRAADNPRLVAHGQTSSQGWRQNNHQKRQACVLVSIEEWPTLV